MGRVKVLKAGMNLEEMKKIFNESDELTSTERGVDTRKYKGVIDWKIDPVAYQRKVRRKWEREIKSS